MSMYDMVEVTPEGYTEGEALREIFDGAAPAAPVRDIGIITEEINFYKQQAGMAILEIGKRLAEAKSQLSHGEWLPWLEEKVEFSERSAQQYIRLWKEYGKSATVADLGVRKALVLLALPESEREEFAAEKHVVDGAEKTARDMTAKELEKAIAERNAAREAAEQAASDVQEAKDTAMAAQEELARVRGELEQLRSRPVEVAVQTVNASEEQIAAARAEAQEAAAAKEKKLAAELDKAQRALERALDDKKAAEAREADAQRERTSAMDAAKSYKAEAEAAAKRAAMAANEGLTRFKVVFDQTVANVNKLAELLAGLPDGEQEKLRRALGALAEQVRRVSA
jgi:hypothetical protein|nr:MAG TPA: Protein of unknown function (DUF3102) [Caudoviricetes sp.]